MLALGREWRKKRDFPPFVNRQKISVLRSLPVFPTFQNESFRRVKWLVLCRKVAHFASQKQPFRKAKAVILQRKVSCFAKRRHGNWQEKGAKTAFLYAISTFLEVLKNHQKSLHFGASLQGLKVEGEAGESVSARGHFV